MTQVITIEQARKDLPLGRALMLGYGVITAMAMSREVHRASKRGESFDDAMRRVVKPKDRLAFDGVRR